MSNLSQFRGSSTQIGDMQFFPESGLSITKSDSSVWVRSGLGLSAASYPDAATNETLKISGTAATNATSILATQVADNGSGTIVIAYGGTNAVLVSTNSGATWTTTAPGQAVQYTGVCWTGTQFVVVANTASAFFAAYSTSGSGSWTTTGNPAVSTATAGTARCVWNGTNVVAVCQASTTSQAATSPNGAITWTAQTTSQAINGVPYLSVGVGNEVVFAATGTTAATKSTTNGTSWSNVTLPANPIGFAYSAASGLYITNQSTSVYHTSSNLTGWTQRNWPPTTTTIGGALSSDSSRFYVGSPSANTPCYYWSTDGIGWTRRWTATSAPSTGGWNVYAGKILLPTTASTTIYYSTSFSTPEQVGSGVSVVINDTASPAQAVGYMRVK